MEERSESLTGQAQGFLETSLVPSGVTTYWKGSDLPQNNQAGQSFLGARTAANTSAALVMRNAVIFLAVMQRGDCNVSAGPLLSKTLSRKPRYPTWFHSVSSNMTSRVTML